MRRTRRSTSGADDPPPAAAKKQRGGGGGGGTAAAATQPLQQRGIAAAFAAGSERRTTDVVLEQQRPRDELERRLAEDLNTKREAYLTAWSDKCCSLGDGAGPAGKGRAAGSLMARKTAAAATAAPSKEDFDLDSAALRYLEAFQHLQQQAFKHGVCFDPCHLELLVLIVRSDVLHAVNAVSHQAYCLLRGYLQRFPYASLARQQGGQYDGRPCVALDERAAWQPLAARTKVDGLTKQYLFEEAIKDAGHNYRVDHSGGSRARKKGGLMTTTLRLLTVCFDRAVDSVDEDHNGDLMLLRYLLALIHQDLSARLAVFAAYADVEDAAVQARRGAVLQNSLLWRIWLDVEETDKERQHLVELVMKLVVGVGSEEDLQEVDEEHHALDKEAEAAAPCVCTPRELAAMAGLLLNMLLDLFGVAEAAGGFVGTGSNRMHRRNERLLLDKMLKELFWTKAERKCRTDDSSRTFLAALAPAHRLRLLSLVAMDRVGNAYSEVEGNADAVARARELNGLVHNAKSGDLPGAFPADPVVALRCLNHDKTRSIKVFTAVGCCSPINNLAILGSGIALAALAMAADGCELPIACGEEGGEEGAAEGRRQLREELQEFITFVADKHKEQVSAGKAVDMTRASLLELLHAQAALKNL